MLLVSYEFGAFLIILAALYYVVPDRFQWAVLLAFSYLFYARGGVIYLLYPLITTASTCFLARAMGDRTLRFQAWVKEKKPGREEKTAYNRKVKAGQRRLLVLGLVLNFGILTILKYCRFFLENVNAFLGLGGGEGAWGDWILPLGISYYTFQSMGYLIDVYYRKYEPEKSPVRFALFVSFFPQMVAGPISRFDQMRQELYSPHRFQMENIILGARRMLWGYFKKLVVADRLGPAVVVIISSPETYDGIYVLLGMVGYTIWMYADFAGGMDIVLGSAKLFGISLPENFDRPFASKSLGEFWRRWHMTLMLWLREYIFFPVSTSRLAKRVSKPVSKIMGKKAAGKVPVYIATLTVWLVAGIWHGASWNFIAWGLANGVVLLVSQELTGCYRRFHAAFSFGKTRAYEIFQVIRTFFIFAFLEMFEYYSFGTVFAMGKSLLTCWSAGQLFDGRFEDLGLSGADLGVLALGVALMVWSGFRKTKEAEKGEHRTFFAGYIAVFGLFLLVVVTGVYGRGYDASQFIYNQF